MLATAILYNGLQLYYVVQSTIGYRSNSRTSCDNLLTIGSGMVVLCKGHSAADCR